MSQPIERVVFIASVEMPGGSEYTTTVGSGERTLSADYHKQCVVIDGCLEIPMHLVKEIRRTPMPAGAVEVNGLACDQPDCDFEGESPAGLGAHKRQKHGIVGTSREPRA